MPDKLPMEVQRAGFKVDMNKLLKSLVEQAHEQDRRKDDEKDGKTDKTMRNETSKNSVIDLAALQEDQPGEEEFVEDELDPATMH